MSRRKVKIETSRLEVERTSLLLELGAAKDEVSSLHSQAGKDKEVMEEDYQTNKLCVPNVQELKKKLMYESHNTVFTMHPGGNKMY